MKRLISTLALAVVSAGAFAQVKVGQVAPDFTLTDINGASQHLYSYLDSGYTVILDVSAAWCGPCWSAHQSHVFEDLVTHYGLNGTVTPGKVKVIFIEGESTNTTAQLHGTSSGSSYATFSQGDWVAGTNYPIIDNASQNANYLYGGFPSFTIICRNRLVLDSWAGYSSTMGAESYWMNKINAGCPNYAPSANDITALGYTGKNYFLCGNVTPAVSFLNYSPSAITAATVDIFSGSTKIGTQSWTGNVAPYAVGTINITSSAFTTAPTTFGPYNYVINVAGDPHTTDNGKTNVFNVYAQATAVSTPWTENFETATATAMPSKMITSDIEDLYPFKSSGSYVLTGANGSTGTALMFGFPQVSSGTVLEAALGNFNTGTASTVTLEFDVAYANASGATDKLEIFASNDCGATWTSVWTKSGATLGTTPAPASGAFVPTAASMWRHETVSLTAKKGNNMVLRAVGTDGGGHYAFMDNLKITNTLGVGNVISNNTVNLYPNPARETATLEFTMAKGGKVVVNVLDATGRTVAVAADATMAQGAQHVSIPTANLAAGVYNITIQTEEGTLTQRLSVVK